MPSPPPKVIYEERGAHHAVIWYERPARPEGPAPGTAPRRRAPHEAPAQRFPAPRIGLVVPSWGRACGVAEYSRNLAQGLQQLGCPVDAASAQGADPARLAREKGQRVVHFQHEYSLWDPRALRRQAMDLLRSGVRTVATVHALADVPDHNAVLSECFNALVVHSEAMRRQLLERHGLASHRVRLIPMGVASPPLPDRGEARARFGLGGEPAIGFVGFFYPQKGVVELGLAVERLRREFPGLRCYLFANVAGNEGSRRYFDHVRDQFDARGLWDAIEVRTGYPSEETLAAQLHAMDVIVLPYSEYPARQVSAAVRTAMAADRPVVTTRAFPFSDLDGEVYKIAGNAPEEIAAGIRAVLGSREIRERLLAAARRYREGHSWPRVAAQHLALYRALGGWRA